MSRRLPSGIQVRQPGVTAQRGGVPFLAHVRRLRPAGSQRAAGPRRAQRAAASAGRFFTYRSSQALVS